MGRPSAASEVLRFSPLMQAGGAHASGVERVHAVRSVLSGLASLLFPVLGNLQERRWRLAQFIASEGAHCSVVRRLRNISSSANLFHSEPQAHLGLPLQAYPCLHPLEP
jgi:hypothetical protein